MTPAQLALARYPFHASGGAVETSLFGRRPLIEALIEGVQVALQDRRGRLELIAGAEGSGRSHLLRAAWQEALQLAVDAVPVFLPEDAPSGSLLHLLSLILEALPDERDSEPGEALVSQLRRTRRGPTPDRAMALLDGRLGGRPLLLFVDGMDAMLEGLGGKEQRLLSQMLSRGRTWVIVGAGSGSTGALGSVSGAFSAGLHLRELLPLSVEDTRTLLYQRAYHDGRPALAEALQQRQGTLKAQVWHQVLGGHPDALSRLVSHLDPDQAAWDVLVALGDRTRSRQAAEVGALSPGQRAVLACLGRHFSPLTVGELAHRTFNSHQTTSSHLRYLSKAGWVQALTVGRERYYEVADPLLRECWAARRRDGRQRAVVAMLALRAELEMPRPEGLASGVPQRPPGSTPVPVAIPEHADPLIAQQQLEAVSLHGANLGAAVLAWARRVCAADLVRGGSPGIARALLLDGRSPASVLDRARERVRELATAELLEGMLGVLLARGEAREVVLLGDRVDWSLLGPMERLAWIRAACRIGEHRRAQVRVVDAVAGVEDMVERRRLLAAGYLAVGDLTAALREAELGWDARPGNTAFARLAARAARRLGQLERAAEHAEHAVRQEDAVEEDWLFLGWVHQERGSYRRAMVALERARSSETALQLLWALHVRLGQPERARILGGLLSESSHLLSADLCDLLEGGAGRGLGGRGPWPEDLPRAIASTWLEAWLDRFLFRWSRAPVQAERDLGITFAGPFHADWAPAWGWIVARAAASWPARSEAHRDALVALLGWLETALDLGHEVGIARALLALPRDPRPFAALSSLERGLARALLERAGDDGKELRDRLPHPNR